MLCTCHPYRSDCVFFLMIRRPPRSTLDRSSAASDVYKRQVLKLAVGDVQLETGTLRIRQAKGRHGGRDRTAYMLSLIHISEPTRPY